MVFDLISVMLHFQVHFRLMVLYLLLYYTDIGIGIVVAEVEWNSGPPSPVKFQDDETSYWDTLALHAEHSKRVTQPNSRKKGYLCKLNQFFKR